MKTSKANAIVSAVARWAIERDDIRAMALAGSWARGNPRQVSDIDLLLLSDRAHDYRGRPDIDFASAGYRLLLSGSAIYGVVWSRHVKLLPAAEVELTFAACSWARTNPVDGGTRGVVQDAFRIIFDKDGILAKLVDAVMPG
jgi:predicted nucleotidyltransferase